MPVPQLCDAAEVVILDARLLSASTILPASLAGGGVPGVLIFHPEGWPLDAAELALVLARLGASASAAPPSAAR